MASFAFAVSPLMVFLWTKSFADVVLAALVCIPLLMISLVIMRIVEKEMYEVLRGMKRGTIWLKP